MFVLYTLFALLLIISAPFSTSTSLSYSFPIPPSHVLFFYFYLINFEVERSFRFLRTVRISSSSFFFLYSFTCLVWRSSRVLSTARGDGWLPSPAMERKKNCFRGSLNCKGNDDVHLSFQPYFLSKKKNRGLLLVIFHFLFSDFFSATHWFFDFKIFTLDSSSLVILQRLR